MRRRPPNRLGEIAAPPHLFIVGIAIIVCFLLQQNLYVRIIQVVMYSGLASLAGKRIRWLYFVFMLLTITLFNAFTPIGEVLLRIGPITVTRGALRQGLLKGFAIPGLVFISLFAVQPTLKLPGRLGGLVARVFFYFERLLDGRKRITLRRFVGTIDALLLEMVNEASQPEEGPNHRTSAVGYAVLGSIVVLNVAPLIAQALRSGVVPDL